MQFVILDLEWNTAYDKIGQQYVSEIIEFGAVKLNEALEVTDTFARFVKPEIEPKLHSRVKKLTNISNQDVNGAGSFLKVAEEFTDWIADLDHTVILSWGDMDIRSLTENYHYYLQSPYIPFLKYYADAQAYFMKLKHLQPNQQIGLSNAAELVQIDSAKYVHHRALGDCQMTAVIFRRIYEEEQLTPFIKTCNEEYYKRLLFKPYIIKDLHSPFLDRNDFSCQCIKCHVSCTQDSEWKFSGSSFSAFYHCPSCSTGYRCNVQTRRLYSQINTKKTVTQIEE